MYALDKLCPGIHSRYCVHRDNRGQGKMIGKTCLLLIGSSRYRLLYHSSERVCKPIRTVNWTHCRQDAYEVVGGKLCASHDPLGALAYFLHYGVASDTYHLVNKVHGYTNHAHLDWNGPGAQDEAHPQPNSPLLVYEAVLRFRHAFPDCRPRAVFTSFVWDIARHRDHFKDANRAEWLYAFKKNFSTALWTVSSLIDVIVDIPFRMDHANDDVIEAIRTSAQNANATTVDSSKLGFQPNIHQSVHESHRWWQTFLPTLK